MQRIAAVQQAGNEQASGVGAAGGRAGGHVIVILRIGLGQAHQQVLLRVDGRGLEREARTGHVGHMGIIVHGAPRGFKRRGRSAAALLHDFGPISPNALVNGGLEAVVSGGAERNVRKVFRILLARLAGHVPVAGHHIAQRGAQGRPPAGSNLHIG